MKLTKIMLCALTLTTFGSVVLKIEAASKSGAAEAAVSAPIITLEGFPTGTEDASKKETTNVATNPEIKNRIRQLKCEQVTQMIQEIQTELYAEIIQPEVRNLINDRILEVLRSVDRDINHPINKMIRVAICTLGNGKKEVHITANPEAFSQAKANIKEIVSCTLSGNI